MENHLGELWSLFHFLLPGWLGDLKSFNRDYRAPIEKRGSDVRLQHLNGRIKPFLLRRTKEQVATELPPKTEIIHWVDLNEAQRDVYETMRLAMDKKVRDEITRKGVGRSQIIILEALLKLRQVCCDLRLVSDTPPKKGSTSGKLDSLMTMLEELFAEGRRILLFSQFTSMLELIEAAKIDGANDREILFKIKIPMVMPSVTICTFLTLTNSFKLFDQNLSLTGGEPMHQTEMMALNIYDTFYGRVGYEGVGQAKAVIFFIIVVAIGMIQLYATKSKEVQQ